MQKQYKLQRSFTVKNLLIATFAFLIASSPLTGKEKPFENRVFRESIHSVRFFREGWEFSMPILELGADQHLLLRFDELSNTTKNYSYTLTLCDFNWSSSSLMKAEYMQGFSVNPLNDFKRSINTTLPYTSYSLILPNENVKILLSGNYILTVFEEGNEENPVLTRRFYVVESSTKINGVVKNATYDPFKGPNQEIDFTVTYPGISIQDPRNEIKVAILQNSGSAEAITGLKPLFVKENQLIYDYNKENVFSGGNEFRNFDIKNLQSNGLEVENIEYVDPLFHVKLKPDEVRNQQIYLAEDDLNGHYLVKNDRANDAELESDYVLVHFTLQKPNVLPEGDVYIWGELSDWNCLPQNRMIYHPETGFFEGEMLLKQGFYDYRYVFVPRNGTKPDPVLLEGSHVETENDYHIFVYYHGFSSRYDRLTGYQTINSVKR